MGKEKITVLKNIFIDISYSGVLLIIFGLLGYYSREFALDLQALSVLDEWGAF